VPRLLSPSHAVELSGFLCLHQKQDFCVQPWAQGPWGTSVPVPLTHAWLGSSVPGTACGIILPKSLFLLLNWLTRFQLYPEHRILSWVKRMHA
jgi:hypothetical protein